MSTRRLPPSVLVSVRIPRYLLRQFENRYPVAGAKRALVKAAFTASVIYPELAHRLMREYETVVLDTAGDPAYEVPHDATPT